MSRKLVSFEFTFISLNDPKPVPYSVFESFFKNMDDDDHWPVETYNSEEGKVTFQTVTATIDDVLDFAKLIFDWIAEMVKISIKDIEGGDSKKAEVTKELLGFTFVIEGEAIYTFGGEHCRFRIECENQQLTIQESENYVPFGADFFDNYQDFCDTSTIYDVDLGTLCKEEDFSPEFEYNVTWDKIYIDEYPPYGKKVSAKKYMRAGVVYSTDVNPDEEEFTPAMKAAALAAKAAAPKVPAKKQYQPATPNQKRIYEVTMRVLSDGKTHEVYDIVDHKDLSDIKGYHIIPVLKTLRQYDGIYYENLADRREYYAATKEALEATRLEIEKAQRA